MYDPRWDDARDRDDGRARVYDERDRTDHDPRDGLMHDLDLPRGDARELVIDRDRVYELNGEDSRTLAAVGAFRVVPERDLGTDRDDALDRDTLDHLRDEGLIRTVALGEDDRAVVLTDEGRAPARGQSARPRRGRVPGVPRGRQPPTRTRSRCPPVRRLSRRRSPAPTRARRRRDPTRRPRTGLEAGVSGVPPSPQPRPTR